MREDGQWKSKDQLLFTIQKIINLLLFQVRFLGNFHHWLNDVEQRSKERSEDTATLEREIQRRLQRVFFNLWVEKGGKGGGGDGKGVVKL